MIFPALAQAVFHSHAVIDRIQFFSLLIDLFDKFRNIHHIFLHKGKRVRLRTLVKGFNGKNTKRLKCQYMKIRPLFHAGLKDGFIF